MVIWPAANEGELLHGPNYAKYALTTLREDDSSETCPQRKQMAEYVLFNSSASKGVGIPEVTALHAVAAAACRWGDFDLWSRALRKCNAETQIEKIGVDGIVEAIDASTLR